MCAHEKAENLGWFLCSSSYFLHNFSLSKYSRSVCWVGSFLHKRKKNMNVKSFPTFSIGKLTAGISGVFVCGSGKALSASMEILCSANWFPRGKLKMALELRGVTSCNRRSDWTPTPSPNIYHPIKIVSSAECLRQKTVWCWLAVHE